MVEDAKRERERKVQFSTGEELVCWVDELEKVGVNASDWSSNEY